MNVDFKYEIGDFVYLRQEVKRWNDLFGEMKSDVEKRGYESMGDLAKKERKPGCLQILERHFQECYGGIQLHYHVRWGKDTAAFTEPEITADCNEKL